MPKTYLDMEMWTPAEAWRTIRTVRSAPPERFAGQLTGARKEVFHAGLEQAQQQFDAAAAVGYDSRPLNLFYGLSQAGRALSAASPHLRGTSWRSTSHGLSVPAPTDPDFWGNTVQVRPRDNDTFSRVSLALGSPTDGGSIALGALAASIPHFVSEFRSFLRWPVALNVREATERGNGRVQLRLRAYPGRPSLDAATEWIAHYPDFNQSALVEVGADGAALFDLQADSPSVDQTLGHEVGNTHYAVPQVGDSSQALHPIANWWLLLYGFSVLSRYHPREWTMALDIRANPAASQVEYLLDLAVSAVPEAIARHLWDSPWR